MSDADRARKQDALNKTRFAVTQIATANQAIQRAMDALDDISVPEHFDEYFNDLDDVQSELNTIAANIQYLASMM